MCKDDYQTAISHDLLLRVNLEEKRGKNYICLVTKKKKKYYLDNF